MELREFAEQILFATTLEEKLRRPPVITDDRPGPAIIAPQAPGRPPELRFKPQGTGKADFPGIHRLSEPQERGRLLHFFANHELLATELMALVLLRFPDASPAFRKGVLRTLQDEQEHTRLYLERMRQCGIAFGELRVSGYFWRAISGMENPMDYVAGLSLTFEQANLDFASHFARGFARAGDTETARLLERIYRDEIGHVAYGLKWFRRWKDPQQSDWEAFCRQLKYPLSPNRAKGAYMNIAGRRAAGLSPEYVAQLNVYSQSKGRTPSVFWFNPLAEGYLAHGRSFTPGHQQRMLVRDLENLPQFLCRQDDVVLVHHRPPVEFLNGIKQAGFPVPEFVELKGNGIDPCINHRKLGMLRPWAWGPDSRQLLEPLFPNVTGEQRNADERFNGEIAQLYSKAWSASLLRRMLQVLPRHSWLCTENEVGIETRSLAATLAAFDAIRARGHHRVVIKQALGLAGQNAIRLWEPELLESQRRWIDRALEIGSLVVEPWLERAVDFSIQLEMTKNGLKVCGYTGLINDLKGQFQANWAGPNYQRQLPASVREWFRGDPSANAGVQECYREAFRLLEQEFQRVNYVGPAGIDALIYRASEGEHRLKPIVEINPRYTMGRLTVELMKQTVPGSHGLFRLLNRKSCRQEGFADFSTYARSLAERCPVRLEGEPVARIREGALCLNDPVKAQVCLAVFEVSRTFQSHVAAEVTRL